MGEGPTVPVLEARARASSRQFYGRFGFELGGYRTIAIAHCTLFAGTSDPLTHAMTIHPARDAEKVTSSYHVTGHGAGMEATG